MNNVLLGVLATGILATAGLPRVEGVSPVAREEAPQGQSKVGQAPRGLHLTLIRDYGRAIHRQCRVHAGVYEGYGVTELWCDYAPSNKKFAPLTARIELTAEEVNRLDALFTAAKLFEGRHVGCDGTPSDGIFETLKVYTNAGTVVLVTTCNTSFEDDAARRELLAMFKTFEDRLRKSARPDAR